MKKFYLILIVFAVFVSCKDTDGDNVYDKEFIEYLHQMANDVMTGKVKTIPWTEKDAEEFKQLMSIEDDE